MGDDDWTLVLVLHHIICDDWSLRLILDDIQRAYHDPAALERVPQRRIAKVSARVLDQAAAYWRSTLAGSSRSLGELLVGRKGVEPGCARVVVPHRVSGALRGRLDSLARARGTDGAALMLAAARSDAAAGVLASGLLAGAACSRGAEGG